jgi:hypothetical protein
MICPRQMTTSARPFIVRQRYGTPCGHDPCSLGATVRQQLDGSVPHLDRLKAVTKVATTRPCLYTSVQDHPPLNPALEARDSRLAVGANVC